MKQKVKNRLVSVSQPCPGLSAAAFLHHGLGRERFYWADGSLTLAGFGTAAELFAWGELRFQQMEAQARQLFAGAVIEGDIAAAPRLFGGFAFRDDFTPDNTWSVFHPAHFILPHFQFSQQGDQTWLTLNALLPADEDPAQVLPDLREALEFRVSSFEFRVRSSEFQVSGSRFQVANPQSPVSQSPVPSLSISQSLSLPSSPLIHYPLTYRQWSAMITEATTRMKQGEMDKVVLARVCEMRFPETVAVDAALTHLTARYPGCMTFLFEPRPQHAFFGATPELLARVQGDRVETMALAGSIRRGRDLQEDELLSQTILADPKSRYEHDVVVQSLRRRLGPLTDELTVPPTGLLKLSYIQHLHTPVSGQLCEAKGILPLLETLHPTPALGGSPRPRAMAFIRESEPVTRGWYAAPIGWIDHHLDGAFGVAIRSAVTQLERAWLYAGAGIVADSDPQKEWEETALKFSPIRQAMGSDKL
ncbi:MAG: isochorismate synthase [Candidatus Promineifilaceae bacterium]